MALAPLFADGGILPDRQTARTGAIRRIASRQGRDGRGPRRRRATLGTGIVAILLLGCTAVRATELSAQAQPPSEIIDVGDRARVQVDRPWVSPQPVWVGGLVVRATPDSLWIEGGEDPTPIGFAPVSYHQLQVRVRRPRGHGAGRGLWMGALAGALVGGILGTAATGGDEDIQAGQLTGWVALAGAILVAPVGAIVGAVAPGGRWVPARLPQ